MKPRVVAIVQARMGSTRFPGKMLAPLGGRPLLEWVLRRVARAERLDETVLATSILPRDDRLVSLAGECGVRVFRGDEADVLGRFVGAAAFAAADTVVRVCADNPFVDPGELDRLVSFFGNADCDYACNHLDRLGSRYADGFGAEILRLNLLQHLAATATANSHREHVTSYLWDHADANKLKSVPAPTELAHPGLRFDVDTPADLCWLEGLVGAGANIETKAHSMVKLALKYGATGKTA